MRRPAPFLLALASLTLTVRPAAAQADPDAPTRALLVRYGGDFGFGSYLGTALSAKRVRGDRAVRFGLSFFGGVSNSEGEGTVEDDGSTFPVATGETSDTFDQFGFGGALALEREWTLTGRGPLRAYGLAGPTLTLQRNRLRQTNERVEVRTYGERQAQTMSTRDFRLRGFSVGGGLTAGMGVEWRVARGVGLTAEYRSEVDLHRSVSRTTETTASTDAISDPTLPSPRVEVRRVREESRSVGYNLDLRSNGVTAGVALYF